MNQKGFSLVVVLIVVSILALGVGGVYYFSKTSLQQRDSNPNSTKSSQVIISPTPYKTNSDWKTYTDSINNFTIKFPPDWKENTNPLDNTSPKFESPNINYDDVSGRIDKGSFVFVSFQKSDKTLSQIENELKAYNLPANSDAPSIQKVERTSLSDMEAIKHISKNGPTALSYTLVNAGYKYDINCNFLGGDLAAEKLCENIISTFQILR